MRDIGILLREARENKGLEILRAASDLKIRAQYIEMMENGDTSKVSKEIYLTGYLKSYANWLGMNGNELVSRLKKESSEFNIAKISTETSAFFSIEDATARPSGKILIISVIMTIIIYSFWYSSRVSEPIMAFEHINMLGQFPKADGEQAFAGFKYGANEDYNFILLANEETLITIIDSEGNTGVKNLNAGEIYFLNPEKGGVVKSDNPYIIDVFADDESNKFLGTLEELSR